MWLVVVQTFAWETLHVTERLPIWGLLIVSGPDRLQHDPTTVTPPHRRTTPLYRPFNAVNTQSLCYLTVHHRDLSENPDIMSQRGLLLKIPLITFATHFKRMHHAPTPASLSLESPLPRSQPSFQMPPGSSCCHLSPEAQSFLLQSGLFTPSPLQIRSHPILNHFVQWLSRERYHSGTV